MRRKLLPFLLILLAFSCTPETKYSTVTINEQYSLEVPDHMEPGELSEDASFEYQNLQRELYAVVIDEQKETLNGFGLEYDLDTYMKIAMREIDSSGTVKPVKQKIGGLNALHAGLKGQVNGHQAVYRLTVIETPKRFYQLLIWTMDSWYERNRGDIEKIESSFKEIGKK